MAKLAVTYKGDKDGVVEHLTERVAEELRAAESGSIRAKAERLGKAAGLQEAADLLANVDLTGEGA